MSIKKKVSGVKFNTFTNKKKLIFPILMQKRRGHTTKSEGKGQDFLNKTPKVLIIKEKIHLIKLKLLIIKTCVKKVKR